MQSQIYYGADYNPEQWLETPEIWDEDLRLMDLGGFNSASIGIFSWASMEPHEGQFDFGWLDQIVEKLVARDTQIFLATPSGAKPAWLALGYPETRRCKIDGTRALPGGRHNHCLTSPVYREKIAILNHKLAERYGHLPQIALWHLSNEYGGYCYCDLCQAAFREWLQARYVTLDALNHAWWTRFWSHTFTEWSQIGALDNGVHGMMIDWRRFMTDQCVDFMKSEIQSVREVLPDAKFTTNMMLLFQDYNYWKFAPHLDVISWDSYPQWHLKSGKLDDFRVAASTAFSHDLYRTLGGGKPWILMEKTPGAVNWKPLSRPMRPGLNRLSGLQAVAHGADGVCYFQWRKSRGSMEKFHGAVVDHAGHENTRNFRECAELGADLKMLAPVVGARTKAQVAIVFDWENWWAIDASQGQRNIGKEYPQTLEAHYLPFYERGIAVDIIESTSDLSPYKLVIAPMLYMVRPGVSEAISEFVKNGGTFVATYLTGIADQSDLCFLGGFPGPLREVLGIWIEENDVLPDDETQIVQMSDSNALDIDGEYAARQFCDILHAENAQVLATFGKEYYAGTPALTVNQFGAGKAYFVASRNEERFNADFLSRLASDLGIEPVISTPIPSGLSVQMRSNSEGDFLFLMNFQAEATEMEVPAGWQSVVGEIEAIKVALDAYSGAVLRRAL